MIKRVSAILGLVLMLAAIITTMFKVDVRWDQRQAFADVRVNMQLLMTRLDQKIDMDRAHTLQDLMTKILIQYGPNKAEWPSVVVDSYLNMDADYKELMLKYRED